MKKEEKKVVVTTRHRGVFFGTLVKKVGDEVHLKDASVCVHWSSKTRGFVGLAATGPMEGSRVSVAAPMIELIDCTAVLHCSDEAIERWEKQPWS